VGDQVSHPYKIAAGIRAPDILTFTFLDCGRVTYCDIIVVGSLLGNIIYKQKFWSFPGM
jgi:hypothetical protein